MAVMYGDTNLEDMLLAYFWIARKYGRDRRAAALQEDTNILTGLPATTAGLTAVDRAVSGPAYALSLTPVPSGLASSMIRYHAVPNMPCAETRHCEGCRQLDLKPKIQWSPAERELHDELTYRIKLAAHALAAEGYVELRPNDIDGMPQPYGEDGMTARFQCTPRGLMEAQRRCQGTAWESESNNRGWGDALTKHEFSQTPDYVQARGR